MNFRFLVLFIFLFFQRHAFTKVENQSSRDQCQNYKNQLSILSQGLRNTRPKLTPEIKEGLSKNLGFPTNIKLGDLEKMKNSLLSEYAILKGLGEINRQTKKAFRRLSRLADPNDPNTLDTDEKIFKYIADIKKLDRQVSHHHGVNEFISDLTSLPIDNRFLQGSEPADRAAERIATSNCGEVSNQNSKFCQLMANDHEGSQKLLTLYLESARRNNGKGRISEEQLKMSLNQEIDESIISELFDYNEELNKVNELSSRYQSCNGSTSGDCETVRSDLQEAIRNNYSSRNELILNSTPHLASVKSLNNELKKYNLLADTFEQNNFKSDQLVAKALSRAFPNLCQTVEACNQERIFSIDENGQVILKGPLKQNMSRRQVEKRMAEINKKLALLEGPMEAATNDDEVKFLSKMINYMAQPKYFNRYCDQEEQDPLRKMSLCHDLDGLVVDNTLGDFITSGNQLLGHTYGADVSSVELDQMAKRCRSERAKYESRTLFNNKWKMLCKLVADNMGIRAENNSANARKDKRVLQSGVYFNPETGQPYRVEVNSNLKAIGQGALQGFMAKSQGLIGTVLKGSYLDMYLANAENQWQVLPSCYNPKYTDSGYCTEMLSWYEDNFGHGHYQWSVPTPGQGYNGNTGFDF